jgi:hypothetical protein
MRLKVLCQHRPIEAFSVTSRDGLIPVLEKEADRTVRGDVCWWR